MKFIVNFAKTIRNHWKKSIVFTGIGIYGVKYANELYEEDLLRREYCAEAKKFGDQASSFGEKSRKITVFLNPAARGGRGRKLFEKNAAPLLYLAGIEVNVVKTEYEGQVKEFFKYLETQHVDGIVVAGGNGTLVETVTGILRKENTTFSRKVPVGVIPVGETNMFATYFYGADKTEVRRMLDAAMAVVKGSTEKLDVLKIEGDGGKTTYALCGLQAGVYRDARGRASKYWYLGPLKHRFTYLRSSFGLWPPVMHGKLEYTEARDTDIPVKKAAEKFIEEKPAQQSRSFVMSILGIFSGHFRSKMQKAAPEAEEDEVEVEYTNTHTVDTNLDSLEITISTGYQTQERKGISLGLAPANISKTHFISEGWHRISEPIWKMDWDTNSQVPCRRVKLEPEVNPEKESWYNIDGEQFEAMPIEVTLLKNKLKFFKCQTQPS